MTKAQALKLLRDYWRGHTFTYDVAAQYNPSGGTKETRDVARAEYTAHLATKPTDPEALKAWKAECARIRQRKDSYRCTIGHILETPFGGCFSIDGQGDSWDEAATAAKLG